MKTKKWVNILNLIAALSTLGCTVQASKGSTESEKNKDVDISTPAGSLNINTKAAAAADLGVAIYPGAWPKPDSEDDHNNSNTNLSVSSSFFGMKLVVQKYESKDAPEKIVVFYEKQLSKFGTVIKCGDDATNTAVEHDKDAPISCDAKPNNEYKIELKVGTETNQHIVAVKPHGKGSAFAVVYVRVKSDKE